MWNVLLVPAETLFQKCQNERYLIFSNVLKMLQ